MMILFASKIKPWDSRIQKWSDPRFICFVAGEKRGKGEKKKRGEIHTHKKKRRLTVTIPVRAFLVLSGSGGDLERQVLEHGAAHAGLGKENEGEKKLLSE